MNEHLEYRHFDVLQPGPDPDAGMLGSFIIGIPAMTFREFQNNYPGFEPEPAILRSISPEERRKIGLHLWAKMKPDTMFIVRVSGPCPEDIRRTDLWGRRREKVLDLLEVGQGGGVKVFLEVGPDTRPPGTSKKRSAKTSTTAAARGK